MAGGGSSRIAPNARKRVEADTSASAPVRARDGSAFIRCEECKKDVHIALIAMHNCADLAKLYKSLEVADSEKDQVDQPQPKKRLRKGPKPAEPTTKKTKKEKKIKDPNAPKRPPTAFFIFMDEFRKTFKEANPDCKSVATVAKEGGEKWKSLTDEEKKTYRDKHAELKAEYEKLLGSANNAEDPQDVEENAAEKEEEEEKAEEGEEEKVEEDLEDDV
ncbi:high mobility group B protein 7-like [Impatiens glandulifera]|uniref:high mobility group B protein 7-like n=1 Tax=Impatiens glandulifera TaxID=253017 RepID=UPI001FB052BC|nr:high mobility group B protein 7-like [Impatiens glandulifera]